ncbi:MAG: OmpA family protein [Azoarcus sp.]|nr:OmpA family protein [Azoarcus sp.]
MIGGIGNARAQVYEDVILLDFGSSTPAFLMVLDELGKRLDYERAGRFYRLTRVDSFTVWADGQSMTFSAPMFQASCRNRCGPENTGGIHIFSTLTADAPPLEVARIVTPSAPRENRDVAALLKLSWRQLTEVRRLLDEANQNPKATGQELFDVHERLTRIKTRIRSAAAIVRVSFPAGGTTFKPSPDVASVLIASGQRADRVNVRGYTDSRMAGSDDQRIAQLRALAARKFLTDHGIDPEKIHVSSQADGGFITLNLTQKGRAVNRRVEIEFVDQRISELAGLTAR